MFKQHFNDPWAVEDLRSIPGASSRRYVGVAAGHHTLPAGPVILVTPILVAWGLLLLSRKERDGR